MKKNIGIVLGVLAVLAIVVFWRSTRSARHGSVAETSSDDAEFAPPATGGGTSSSEWQRSELEPRRGGDFAVRLSSVERRPGESQALYEARLRDVEFLEGLANEASLTSAERSSLWRVLLDGQITYEEAQLKCLRHREGIEENATCMNDARKLIVDEHWQRLQAEVPSATRAFTASSVEFVVAGSGHAFEKPGLTGLR